MYRRFFYFIFLIYFSISYSIPTYIDSCREINDSMLVDLGDRRVILNQSINASGSCIIFDNNDVDFSCNNFNITGNGTGTGISLEWRGSNSNVSNCNLYDFQDSIRVDGFNQNRLFKNIRIENSRRWGISSRIADRNFFDNITIINTSSIALRVQYGSYSNYTNFFIKDTNTGIDVYNGDNRSFFNFTIIDANFEAISISNDLESFFNGFNIYNSTQAIELSSGSSDHYFENFYLNNISEGIFLRYHSSSVHVKNNTFDNFSFNNISNYAIQILDRTTPHINNSFINSYFENSSNIFIENNASSPQFFNNNFYLNLGVLNAPICFDSPNNLSCDFMPNGYDFTLIEEVQNSSLFPFSSIYFLFFFLFGYFLF